MAKVLGTTDLRLPFGFVRGTIQRSAYGDDYYSFEGIPYAQPPLGELRFRAPLPAQPWEGIRDCTRCASNPSQINEFTHLFEGIEDCLYLNVYAKTLSSSKPLPVLVFIYAGGFTTGGANRTIYGPDCFMMQDVILVNFNYRLCSLGFLSFKDPDLKIPGNAGLKDQVLALKWVRDNVAHFNGNPANITLFGISSGAASAHYMMSTNQTKGLFQKAILMSGCALNTWALVERGDKAYRLAAYHGYKGDNNDRRVYEYLSALDASKLVRHKLLTIEDKRQSMWHSFGPTVESYAGEDCVIPCLPIELVSTGWGNQIPLIIGGTSFEGLIVYPRLKARPATMKDMAEVPEQLLPLRNLNELRDDVPLSELTRKLVDLHFDGQLHTTRDIMKFLHFFSYQHFWHGLKRTIALRLRPDCGSTYFYRFDFDSPTHNRVRHLYCGDEVQEGVSHCDDTCYMFYGLLAPQLAANTPEYRTMRRIVGAWTAFAATGDPNCSQMQDISWPKLSPTHGPLEVLNIGQELSCMPLPEDQKLLVWDSLYKSKM